MENFESFLTYRSFLDALLSCILLSVFSGFDLELVDVSYGHRRYLRVATLNVIEVWACQLSVKL